ncbi:MAG TPA: FkbM family methyltransferase [Gemmatimonadaceae bacterium]|nr:FkbM family methyltransferase [Gemmatimonadaceae bacterium]
MILTRLKQRVRRLTGERLYLMLNGIKVRSRHYCRMVVGLDPRIVARHRAAVERHGEWYLCPTPLTRESVVYSLGIGTDVSFDLSMIARFGTHVFAFDPTPTATAWIRTQTLPAQFHAYPYGVADFDGIADFERPEDPQNPSFSYLGKRAEGLGATRCDVRRLRTLMEMLGHTDIDLLKMDIEGAEYAVIENMIAEGLRVHQLLVEFHHRKPGIGAQKTVVVVHALERAGFRLFHISPTGQEWAFIRDRR